MKGYVRSAPLIPTGYEGKGRAEPDIAIKILDKDNLNRAYKSEDKQRERRESME